MSSNLYKIQEKNIWKTWALMVGFLVLIILIGWFLSLYYGSPMILYVAVIFAVLMNFISYWQSDKIVLKLAGAKEAKKEEFYDLYTIVENLSITAGLPMPKVYVVNDPSPNAFATGRNEKHAVVAVTTGLLHILEKNELEGVVAHELSHIKNKDILLQSVIVVLVGLIAIASDIFVRSTFYGRGDRDSKGGGVLLVIGLVLMLLSPLIATVIQLAISRKREFMADASGALLTRYPEGLASALQKISANPTPLKKARNATAHLYISDPFKSSLKQPIANGQRPKAKTGFFQKMFLTHPPVEERVGALLGKN